jgi:hypothetical protein
MGVVPLVGRAFSATNGQPGGERVVIVAHGLWTRRFGADASIVGGHIVLNGVSHEVIGVMPRASSTRPTPSSGCRSRRRSVPGRFRRPRILWLTIVGRLNLACHQPPPKSEMDTIAARLEKEVSSNAGIGIRLVTMHEDWSEM